jgi:hypothetical protein
MLEYCRAVLTSIGRESGQTLAEYSLIFAFIVLAGMAFLIIFAVGLEPLYQTFTDALPS